MEIKMRFDTDAIAAYNRVVDISLDGDPIVVKMLGDLISEFMKKQETPSWTPK